MHVCMYVCMYVCVWMAGYKYMCTYIYMSVFYICMYSILPYVYVCVCVIYIYVLLGLSWRRVLSATANRSSFDLPQRDMVGLASRPIRLHLLHHRHLLSKSWTLHQRKVKNVSVFFCRKRGCEIMMKAWERVKEREEEEEKEKEKERGKEEGGKRGEEREADEESVDHVWQRHSRGFGKQEIGGTL